MIWHYIIHDKDYSWISRAEWMWSQEISTRTVWLPYSQQSANGHIIEGAERPLGVGGQIWWPLGQKASVCWDWVSRAILIRVP